jgi:hypothetical protein
MADAVEPAKRYENFVKDVNSYVELVKEYYEKPKNKPTLSAEDEDDLHERMIGLSNELLEIKRKSPELSNYFAGVSVPHFNTIMETTPFNLKAFMGIHFSEVSNDVSDDTSKFNSKRKTSKGRKSGRKTSKGRKSGRKTSKGRKSGRKTSKGRKVRN